MLVDSPLLLYIDVRHLNFLPSLLTIGEAWDLGPLYTTAEDLTPVRDESAKQVSQNHRTYVPIREPEVPIQTVEPVAAKSVNSLEVETDQEGKEMVTRRKMVLSHFVPNVNPSGQQQPPLVTQTPPPAPACT